MGKHYSCGSVCYLVIISLEAVFCYLIIICLVGIFVSVTWSSLVLRQCLLPDYYVLRQCLLSGHH